MDLEEWEILPKGGCSDDREVVVKEAVQGDPEHKNREEVPEAWNEDDKDSEVEPDDGLDMWKLSLTGAGALCSLCFAALGIVGMVVLGSHQKSKQNQNLRLQMFTHHEHQRMKQVVQHATKLNQAISAGLLTKAQITIGGCYDGS